ncbi:MAG: hypothetical protein JWL70_2402, partial [Acidimicrobiia bacterium]|nr:hypothetical protein [Acidimicrobiia bacterium]
LAVEPSSDSGPDSNIVIAHTARGRRLGRLKPAFTEVPRLDRQDIVVANDRDEDAERALAAAVLEAPQPGRRPELPLDAIIAAALPAEAVLADPALFTTAGVDAFLPDIAPTALADGDSLISESDAVVSTPVVVDHASDAVAPAPAVRSKNIGPISKSMKSNKSTGSGRSPHAGASKSGNRVRTQVAARPLMDLEEIDDILVSRDGLVRLGVPATMIERSDIGAHELPGMLAALPGAGSPDMTQPGVIAFVGELEQARWTASAYVDDVMVACATAPKNVSPWLVVKDAAGVASRRVRWAERPGASVLAVDGAPTIEDPYWTMDVMEAVAAREVRVVVDAVWPMDQIRPWIEGLAAVVGDHPMVIELVGLDAATQPAASMGLNLPIATLDGEPATAQRWSDLLVARMLDEAPMRAGSTAPATLAEALGTNGDLDFGLLTDSVSDSMPGSDTAVRYEVQEVSDPDFEAVPGGSRPSRRLNRVDSTDEGVESIAKTSGRSRTGRLQRRPSGGGVAGRVGAI